MRVCVFVCVCVCVSARSIWGLEEAGRVAPLLFVCVRVCVCVYMCGAGRGREVRWALASVHVYDKSNAKRKCVRVYVCVYVCAFM